MSKITQWLSRKLLGLRTGTKVVMANDGKPIEVVTIKYKDYYFFMDIDVESGEPTGGYGWSTDPTMNPTVKTKDILQATRMYKKGK